MLRKIALLSLVAATAAGAQGTVPPAPPQARQMAPFGGARAAETFLARTGELGLTDAQVTRLAAIARRSETRRVALRAQLDSNRRRLETTPVDTAARRQFRDRMRTTLDREQDQGQLDLRDALAVLNADQQAKAWQLGANRGRGGPGMRGGGMRERRMAPMRERRTAPMRERGERPGRQMRPLRRPFDG